MLCCFSINQKQMNKDSSKKITNKANTKTTDQDNKPISIKQMQLEAIASLYDDDSEIK